MNDLKHKLLQEISKRRFLYSIEIASIEYKNFGIVVNLQWQEATRKMGVIGTFQKEDLDLDFEKAIDPLFRKIAYWFEHNINPTH